MVHLNIVKNGSFRLSDFWFVPGGFNRKHYDIKLGKITIAQCIILKDGRVIGSKNVSTWRGLYKSIHHFARAISRKTKQKFTYLIK